MNNGINPLLINIALTGKKITEVAEDSARPNGGGQGGTPSAAGTTNSQGPSNGHFAGGGGGYGNGHQSTISPEHSGLSWDNPAVSDAMKAMANIKIVAFGTVGGGVGSNNGTGNIGGGGGGEETLRPAGGSAEEVAWTHQHSSGSDM